MTLILHFKQFSIVKKHTLSSRIIVPHLQQKKQFNKVIIWMKRFTECLQRLLLQLGDDDGQRQHAVYHVSLRLEVRTGEQDQEDLWCLQGRRWCKEQLDEGRKVHLRGKYEMWWQWSYSMHTRVKKYTSNCTSHFYCNELFAFIYCIYIYFVFVCFVVIYIF